MISEQYGTVFTNEHFEKMQKVYSIWICPDPAKKRKNGIFKYHTVEETIYGKPYVSPESYDLMEVVILNLGDTDKSSGYDILDLMNTLFSMDMSPTEKKPAEMMIQDNEPASKIMKYTRLSFETLQEIAARFGKNLVME